MTRSPIEDEKRLRRLTLEGMRSQEHRRVDRFHDEMRRRTSQFVWILERMGLVNEENLLLIKIWESSGARSFKEITALGRSIGIKSQTTVSRYLKKYLRLGLVEQLPDGRYRAAFPKWLQKL